MAVTVKKLFNPVQPGTSATTLYTAPLGTNTIIKKLTFTNVDSVVRTVTVYLVPSGGSAGVTNLLTDLHSIAVAETFECFEAEGQVLNAGDSLQALCSAASAVTAQGSGVEIV